MLGNQDQSQQPRKKSGHSWLVKAGVAGAATTLLSGVLLLYGVRNQSEPVPLTPPEDTPQPVKVTPHHDAPGPLPPPEDTPQPDKAKKAYEPITQKEVNVIYLKLQEDLRQAMQKAKDENKRLYVLLGEGHSDGNSLLIEAIIASIFHQLDQGDFGRKLFVEMDSKLYKDFIEPEEIPFSWLKEAPNAIITAVACKKYFDKKIVPIDHDEIVKKLLAIRDKSDQKTFDAAIDATIDERDAHMAKMLKSPENSVGGLAVVGAAHLKGITERLADEMVLPILVMGKKSIDDFYISDLSKSEIVRKRLEFAQNPEKVCQLEVHGTVDKDVKLWEWSDMRSDSIVRVADMVIAAARNAEKQKKEKKNAR